jgi:tRNA threonylcarbamoyladenosine biosynthesis protein TsaB
MILLAIDTSTEFCSAALLCDGLLSARGATLGRGHAERILPMVDELLADAGLVAAQLQGVAFGRGPGAFTGLRIAAGVAQGLAYAAGCRVAAVSSLAAVAWQVQALPGERVLACNDARMGEVYWAVFEAGPHGLLRPCGAERVTSPHRIAVGLEQPVEHAAGNALAAVPGLRDRLEGLGLRIHDGLLPTAEAVARLGLVEFAAGRSVTPAEAQPVYVRDEVISRPVTPVS